MNGGRSGQCISHLRQGLCVLALATAPLATMAMPCADMALVLAIDASGSITDAEFTMQIQATARALVNPQVVRAMADLGGVAVAAVIWGDSAYGVHPLPWVHVRDFTSASRFALTLASQTRVVSGNTDIGNGISAALDLLDDPRNCATRLVIDVSGDGRESVMSRRIGTTLPQAKARADAAGVVINGLAISINDPGIAMYYHNHVIEGEGSFVIEATSYGAFEQAMIRKLLREVGGYGTALTADAGMGQDAGPIVAGARLTGTDRTGTARDGV